MSFILAALVASLLQTASPFTFAGITLPLKSAEVSKRLHVKPACSVHAKEKVTVCKASRVKITGPEAGTYDVSWDVNDPPGLVAAVVFTRRDAAFTAAQVQAMRVRWNRPDQDKFDTATPGGVFLWWGKALSARWLARITNFNAPNVLDVTIGDNVELEATNRRAAALRR
jgi:hypothetical protein